MVRLRSLGTVLSFVGASQGSKVRAGAAGGGLGGSRMKNSDILLCTSRNKDTQIGTVEYCTRQ